MSCDWERLKETRGIVFDLKRFAVHDGPGIRTVVFVKGCQMDCWWCHNPESKRREPEIFLYVSKCRHCGGCVGACPEKLHRLVMENGQALHLFDRERCSRCGKCVEACYYSAIGMAGKSQTAGEVMAEVLEDRHYYVTSGGGMTISGGEPTLQPEFIFALLTLAKAEKIHTAVDTNAGGDRGMLEKILPVTDLFLIDLKQMDAAKHEEFTGRPLAKVLENLEWLSDNGGKIMLRCPIIPSVNADDDEHWKKVAQIAKQFDGVVEVEYLPYHRLWVSKSQGLGLSVCEERKSLTEISPGRIAEIETILKTSKKLVAKG